MNKITKIVIKYEKYRKIRKYIENQKYYYDLYNKQFIIA